MVAERVLLTAVAIADATVAATADVLLQLLLLAADATK